MFRGLPPPLKSDFISLEIKYAIGIRGAEQEKVKRFLAAIDIADMLIAKIAAHIKTEAIIKCNPFFAFEQHLFLNPSV